MRMSIFLSKIITTILFISLAGCGVVREYQPTADQFDNETTNSSESLIDASTHYPNDTTPSSTLKLDILFLKNGSILKGKIKEINPNESVKLESSNGDLLVYPMSEILRVVVDSTVTKSIPPAKSSALPQSFLTIGVLQGGSLIGVDFEARIDPSFGIQVGGGVLGGAVALNFHFQPIKESQYLSFNSKFVGFGYLTTVGIEFGSRFFFNESVGLNAQIGFGKVVSISDRASIDTPALNGNPVILTYGIGIVF